MWIYEQTKSEENFSLLPQTVGLPVQTAESALPPVPAQAAEPAEQLTQKEPCIPAKRHATQDCWLLAAAFLVGCTAAGVLQAVCDARQTENCCSIIWKRGKGCLRRAVCKERYSFSAWNT